MSLCLPLVKYGPPVWTVFTRQDAGVNVRSTDSPWSATMSDPNGLAEMNDGAVQQCDGCGKRYSISELVPIGDSSIRVCVGCYTDATALVLTNAVSSVGPQV